MNSTRRKLVLSLPAVASMPMILTGCGGGEGSNGDAPATTQASLGHASAQAVNQSLASGSVGVNSSGGSFPTSWTALRPDDTMVQAVINGQDVHLSFTHLATFGSIAQRTITCTLRKNTPWVEGTPATFVVAGTSGASDGTLEGLISHVPDITASDFQTNRLIYKIASGSVVATKRGEQLQVDFSNNSSNVITASAYASYSANAAVSSNLSVWIAYSNPRTVYLNLLVENEPVA